MLQRADARSQRRNTRPSQRLKRTQCHAECVARCSSPWLRLQCQPRSPALSLPLFLLPQLVAVVPVVQVPLPSQQQQR